MFILFLFVFYYYCTTFDTSFIFTKNQTLQNVFFVTVTMRWHIGIKTHEIWKFKVNILCQKMFESFYFFIEEYQFKTTIFDDFNFKSILLIKSCPIFGNTVLSQQGCKWQVGRVGNCLPRFRQPVTPLSALQLSKKHFVTFHFLVKMNLVLDVVQINATTLIWLP